MISQDLSACTILHNKSLLDKYLSPCSLVLLIKMCIISPHHKQYLLVKTVYKLLYNCVSESREKTLTKMAYLQLCSATCEIIIVCKQPCEDDDVHLLDTYIKTRFFIKKKYRSFKSIITNNEIYSYHYTCTCRLSYGSNQ